MITDIQSSGSVPSSSSRNNNFDGSLPQLLFPRIIACGYKHFISYKSGQTFPAILVQYGPNEFYWRTKKDFLRFKRQQRRQQQQPSSISFPKKAYTKLVSRSPWIIPNFPSSSNDILREKIGRIQYEEQNNTVMINNYDMDMKKSLYSMNDFLRKTTNSYTTTSTTSSSIIHEMSEFFRREDASQLTIVCHNQINKDINDDDYDDEGNIHHSSSMNSSHPQNASAILGQYFASPENVDIVIQVLLDYIKTEIETTTTTRSSFTTRKVVLCEPSCGDGRMIQSFFHTFHKHPYGTIQNHSIHNSHASFDDNDEKKFPFVIGYDIDPNTIQQAHNRLSNHKDHVLLKCTNALLEPSYVPRNTNDDDSTTNHLVVVFGSPPYTTGSGNGSKIKRDLPEKFVHHFIHNWNADLIAFILPKRYKSFHWDEILNIDNSHSTTATFKYSSEAIPLANSTFYENIPEGEGESNMRQIQQPSVLILLKKQPLQNKN